MSASIGGWTIWQALHVVTGGEIQAVTSRPYEVQLYSSSGTAVTTGTTAAKFRRTIADGTLQYLDFDDHTWKASGWTTQSVNLTHRSNGTWTYVWDSDVLNALELRNRYVIEVENSSAVPRPFLDYIQFGDGPGDSFLMNQIANIDGNTAYDTAVETNSDTRSQEIQSVIEDQLLPLMTDLTKATYLHTSTVAAVTNGDAALGADVTIQMDSAVSNAGAVRAGQLVVFVTSSGTSVGHVFVATTSFFPLAGDTFTVSSRGSTPDNPQVGDHIYILPMNVYDVVGAIKIDSVLGTAGLVADATAAKNQTVATALRAAFGMASANLDTQLGDIATDSEALRKKLVRWTGTVSSVAIPGSTYIVTLTHGADTTVGTYTDHNCFVHDSDGNYKSGPHIMGNSGSEGLITIFATLEVGDRLTVARRIPTITEINSSTTGTNAATAATEIRKVPRAATELTAGGDFALNEVIDTATKLTVNYTNEEA